MLFHVCIMVTMMNDDEIIRIMAEEIYRLETENAMLRNQIIKCGKNKPDKRICRKCKEFAEKKSGTGLCMKIKQKVKAFEECVIYEKS